MDFRIEQITTAKKRFLDLLLLGDEQESMIDRYLEQGEMFALYDTSQHPIATAVITQVDKVTIELKNLAVAPSHQRRGYGRRMIEFICEHYKSKYHTLLVETDDSPSTPTFYSRCGFTRSHVKRDFFTLNYDHPIYEEGVLLRDMIYFRRMLHP